MNKNPLREWESKWLNVFPRNPTQAEYIRFQETKFELPENDFDKAMKKMEKEFKDVLRTPYLKILEDFDGDN